MMEVNTVPTTNAGRNTVAKSRDPKKLTRNEAIAMESQRVFEGILIASFDMICD